MNWITILVIILTVVALILVIIGLIMFWQGPGIGSDNSGSWTMIFIAFILLLVAIILLAVRNAGHGKVGKDKKSK